MQGEVQAAATAASTLITDPILTQLTVSGIAVWLLEKLKATTWFPFLSTETANWAKTAWALVIALATGLGIQITFDSTAGQLIVTGLTLSGIGGALWVTAQSFVAQQILYHGIVKPAAPSPASFAKAAAKAEVLEIAAEAKE